MDRMRGNYFLWDDKNKYLAKSHLGTFGNGNHVLLIEQSENTGEITMVMHHDRHRLSVYLRKKGVAMAESYRGAGKGTVGGAYRGQVYEALFGKSKEKIAAAEFLNDK